LETGNNLSEKIKARYNPALSLMRKSIEFNQVDDFLNQKNKGGSQWTADTNLIFFPLYNLRNTPGHTS